MAMPNDEYPDIPAVGRFIAGERDAVYVELVRLSRIHPHRVREFALVAARAVASQYCKHGGEAPRILEGNTTASRAISMAADGGHGGLCGFHQAHIIASVKTQDVLARNSGPVANKFRNQVGTN